MTGSTSGKDRFRVVMPVCVSMYPNCPVLLTPKFKVPSAL